MSAPGTVRQSVNTKSNWRTPPHIFEYWNDRYHFTLDAAADEHNHLHHNYLDEKYDALTNRWPTNDMVDWPRFYGRQVAWCNPPYGKGIDRWISAFIREWTNGYTILALLPAATDTQWWQEVMRSASRIYLLDYRISFINPDTGLPVNGNPTASAFVAWHPTPYEVFPPIIRSIHIPPPPRQRKPKSVTQ